jgi:DNA-binding NtrC family response regulator
MFIEPAVQLDCQAVAATSQAARRPTVLIVKDSPDLSHAFDPMCSYLGIQVETLPAEQNLIEALLAHRPMAVIAEFEGEHQDGCHVLKMVADYDPTLPCLLLTGGDPRLAGAADAVEELWGLTQVHKLHDLSNLADIVEFLFHAGRMGECMRLLRC